MSDSDSLYSLPYGVSAGPSYTTDELLARFLAGDAVGSSPAAHLEGEVLVVGNDPLAIRLDGALLVRDEATEETADLRAALCTALAESGLSLVERDTPLGLIVESETFARRGYEWGLWARDLDEGRAALAARATPDMPGLLDWHEAHQHDQARTDAVLRQMEDDL